MNEFTECPHYRKAEQRNKEWAEAMERAKKEIIDGMRALGLVPENAMVQIENAAAMKADLDDARMEARQYSRLQLKESREGHVSYVTNPIHEQVRTMAATYANMLKDLGFGVKMEKVVTKIGEVATGQTDDAAYDSRRQVDDFRESVLNTL